jgi:hypothetical protein
LIVIARAQLAALERGIDSRLAGLWASAALRCPAPAGVAARLEPGTVQPRVAAAIRVARARGVDAQGDLVLWPAMALAAPFAANWPDALDALPDTPAHSLAAMRRAGLQWRTEGEPASAWAWTLAGAMLESSP